MKYRLGTLVNGKGCSFWDGNGHWIKARRGRKIWCIVRTQSGADFERDFGLEIVHLRIAQLDLKRIGRGEEVEVDSLINLSWARFPA